MAKPGGSGSGTSATRARKYPRLPSKRHKVGDMRQHRVERPSLTDCVEKAGHQYPNMADRRHNDSSYE
jgi:hypothetical protein